MTEVLVSSCIAERNQAKSAGGICIDLEMGEAWVIDQFVDLDSSL